MVQWTRWIDVSVGRNGRYGTRMKMSDVLFKNIMVNSPEKEEEIRQIVVITNDSSNRSESLCADDWVFEIGRRKHTVSV